MAQDALDHLVDKSLVAGIALFPFAESALEGELGRIAFLNFPQDADGLEPRPRARRHLRGVPRGTARTLLGSTAFVAAAVKARLDAPAKAPAGPVAAS
jgi:hypothetical protein